MTAADTYSTARKHMVDSQIHTMGVVDPRLLAALESVPRERFVPKELRGHAYMDEEIPLGNGRYVMEPMLFARMMGAVAPLSTDSVLAIGCGTGYAAAIMAQLVQTVIAVDSDAELMARSVPIWRDLGICNIADFVAPHAQGCPEHAPYDIIFICGAVAAPPTHLLEQLSPEGRLACVLKEHNSRIGRAVLMQNGGEPRGGVPASRTLFDCDAHYLSGFEPQERFVF